MTLALPLRTYCPVRKQESPAIRLEAIETAAKSKLIQKLPEDCFCAFLSEG